MASTSPASSSAKDTGFPDITTDVLIVGAGPVGLTLAYQLRRFSTWPAPYTSSTSPNPIRVHIIEKNPKPAQQRFGRAVTFWPRSMEILDQLGLADDIMQQGVAVRESSAYDSHGQEKQTGGAWSFLEGIADTRYKFATELRQKYVEEILRKRSREFGVGVNEVEGIPRDIDFDGEEALGHTFVGCEIDESVEVGGYRISATVHAVQEGRAVGEYRVKCKYMIGCDGSKTVVREAAGIESTGSRTEDKWVRIDGVFKSTTHPKPRTYGAMESPIYGNVLWIPLDHGATRIGFALNEERRKLYKELNDEAYVAEAKLSVKPFDIEYEAVDWASVYSVGQRVAKSFWAKGCVFLAGDSCHTHSSGAGQGMNAGIHDASNLGWKLALVLRGLARFELLGTYDAERRPNAEQLIKYDEDISVLVSGRLPPTWTGDPGANPNMALGRMLQEAKGFNTGLNISYDVGLAVGANPTHSGATTYVHDDVRTTPTKAMPGCRAPDIRLLRPAMWDGTWLQKLTPNMAQFSVLIFVGSKANYAAFQALQTAIRSNPAAANKNGERTDIGMKVLTNSGTVRYLTVLREKPPNAFMSIGCDPLGLVFFDDDGSAHARYEVEGGGGIFVLRPDGWIGLRIEGLQESRVVVGMLLDYLGGILT